MIGIMVGQDKDCPSCGEETMRHHMPVLLKPLSLVFPHRVRYRRCRRCRKRWLALITGPRRRRRSNPTEPPTPETLFK